MFRGSQGPFRWRTRPASHRLPQTVSCFALPATLGAPFHRLRAQKPNLMTFIFFFLPMTALHASMEKSKTVMRVIRAAAKKPSQRNGVDIGYVMQESQKAGLLTANGPGQHRDLCHVVSRTMCA